MPTEQTSVIPTLTGRGTYVAWSNAIGEAMIKQNLIIGSDKPRPVAASFGGNWGAHVYVRLNPPLQSYTNSSKRTTEGKETAEGKYTLPSKAVNKNLVCLMFGTMSPQVKRYLLQSLGVEGGDHADLGRLVAADDFQRAYQTYG